ncbi:DUF559 domain-containing protein [Tersicoccus sp. MR15.9]|uniref:DUF559 domain-containing protein n=1 Tax=Tersicoccus mangrovi TaxID=3121635 RepID=UPI002FE6ABDF
MATTQSGAQRRLVRTSTLRDRGWNAAAVSRAVRDRRLHRVSHGVYLAGDVWAALTPSDRHRVELHAHALRVCGRGGAAPVFSHESAALLHGLNPLEAPRAIQVTVPYRGHAPGAGVRTHLAVLERRDVVVVDGLHVTSLARTVLDSTCAGSVMHGLVIADQALAAGLATSELLELTSRAVKARRRIEQVVACADGRSESVGETLTRLHLVRWGLPMPVLQHEIHTDVGRYRVDFAWPDARLILEFDGRTKYVDHGPTAEVLYQERRRQNRLERLGWTVIRVDWAEIQGEAEPLRRRLIAALGVSACPTA